MTLLVLDKHDGHEVLVNALAIGMIDYPVKQQIKRNWFERLMGRSDITYYTLYFTVQGHLHRLDYPTIGEAILEYKYMKQTTGAALL